MNIYIIGIGSNHEKMYNMEQARTHLTHLFPDIVFSPVLETKPVNMTNRATFLNQVARFSSIMEVKDISVRLKEIETLSGRTPESKMNEIIPLDIDIILCNDTVLKPEDLKRDYVMRGVRAVSPNKQLDND